MAPLVWNRRRGAPLDAVYVGRPTKWGNPIRLDGITRAECLRRYKDWLRTQPQLVEDMKRELRGRHLVCWCAPKMCHADVILKIANE